MLEHITFDSIMDRVQKERVIVNTLRVYLKECAEDNEDRWMIREVLHRQMYEYDEEYNI